jgi:hypothetical protein
MEKWQGKERVGIEETGRKHHKYYKKIKRKETLRNRMRTEDRKRGNDDNGTQKRKRR